MNRMKIANLATKASIIRPKSKESSVSPLTCTAAPPYMPVISSAKSYPNFILTTKNIGIGAGIGMKNNSLSMES